MNFLNKILALACLACVVLFTVQCEVIDSDLLDDPNNPSPTNLDPNFLLNNIQFEGRAVYAGASGTSAQMTRMRYMFGDTYTNAYSGTSFNGVYGNSYADLFIDTENLLGIAADRGLFFHAGMAKTLKAYAMITLVDVFGDMPMSEALDASNFNPGVDGGQAIYDSALVLLDSAIEDFRNVNRTGFPEVDLYYGPLDDEDAQEEAWIRAANTIKLKAYLNTGNGAAIDALVTQDSLITDPAHNFTFEFGTNIVNPDSRHPFFSNNYVDVANNYMSLSYMNMLLNDKPEIDPRMRYYFYRQTTSDPTDVNLNTCLAATAPGHFDGDDPFCYPEGNGDDDGWWGRDHLIDDGIPPDGDLRTTFGVYPAGGRFDASQGAGTEEDQGYQGAGFDPILMSSYTHFMLAEHENLNNNDPVAAKAELDEAITESFDAVSDFGADQATGSGFEMTGADRTDHTTEVDNRWTGAANQDDRQNIISMEYYLALWPNGLEAYNLMRRTGYPNRDNNLQPTRTPNPGTWYATFLYPSNMVERNSSIDQKPNNQVTTFWDDGTYSTNDFNF